MSGNSKCTVYVGNLDEKVSDRVLYDILIQAGRLVDFYIPRDKESDRPKGYAFAEYETEEIADYAVRLFTGLVTLYNRTLKFAISGHDKQSPNISMAAMPNESSYIRPRPQPHLELHNSMGIFQHPMELSPSPRFSAHSGNYDQSVPAPPGVPPQSNGYRSHFDGNNNDYARRVFGATLDSANRSRSRRHGANDPIAYPPY